MAKRAAKCGDYGGIEFRRFLTPSFFSGNPGKSATWQCSGGLKLNIMNADIWDTGLAVSAYLEIPGRSSSDAEIKDAVEFLIQSQHADGSYAWASNSHNDADNDSTAHAVRALAAASRFADPLLRRRLEKALRRGTGYLLSQ